MSREIAEGTKEPGKEMIFEVLAGSATLSVGVLWAGVETCQPWDVAHGERYDVNGKDAWSIPALIVSGVIVAAHFACPRLPCRGPTLLAA